MKNKFKSIFAALFLFSAGCLHAEGFLSGIFNSSKDYKELARKKLASEGYEVEFSGNYNEFYLFKLSSDDWRSSPILYDSKNNKYINFDFFNDIVDSLRFVKTEKYVFVEIFESTGRGNGDISLYNLQGKCFFSYTAVDSNSDDIPYSEIRNDPFFKNMNLSNRDTISELIKGYKLKSDFSSFDSGSFKLYGTVQYICNEDTLLKEVHIERYFQLNPRNGRYELSKKVGNLSDSFGKY